MKKKSAGRPMIVLFMTALLALPQLLCADSDAGGGGVVLNIAVVDVRTVMKNSREWQHFQHEHQRRREEAEDILRTYQNRLSVLEMEYENLPPGTDRTEEKRQEIESLVQEFQQKQEELSRQYQRQGLEGYRQFYESLSDLLTSYAKEKDIDLILKKQHVDLSVAEMVELEVFETGDVLFAAAELDITEEISGLMNENGADENSAR